MFIIRDLGMNLGCFWFLLEVYLLLWDVDRDFKILFSYRNKKLGRRVGVK